MGETVLTAANAGSAEEIQSAIDAQAAAGGGTVILPPAEIVLDRSLELPSGITLAGRGADTVLRHLPARIYPLTGYHNYGMCDAPLADTTGLEPGMTVSVHDDKRLGFYGTFARITWVDDGWVGLEPGLSADLLAGDAPRLVTRFPLVCAHWATDIAVRDLVVCGEGRDHCEGMNACRGAALYLYQCRDAHYDNVEVRDYNGEGLGFQMCRNVRIRDSRFVGNAGNGLHPGAGSTNVSVRNCLSTGNNGSGFFFCVRANHVTVDACEFSENAQYGVSIGTRDCHNLIENCKIRDNGGAGIATRPGRKPVEAHSCTMRNCEISGNGRSASPGERAQIELYADAHDLCIEDCRLSGDGAAEVGILAESGVRRVFLAGNTFTDLAEDFRGPAKTQVKRRPVKPEGYGAVAACHFRHLPQPARGA
jgi:hypothetical protein